MTSTRSKKMMEMARPVGTTNQANQGKIILKIFKFIDVPTYEIIYVILL